MSDSRAVHRAWLYETLSPHVDEIVVAGIAKSRGPKSDKRDAYGLAEKLRVGNLDKQVSGVNYSCLRHVVASTAEATRTGRSNCR